MMRKMDELEFKKEERTHGEERTSTPKIAKQKRLLAIVVQVSTIGWTIVAMIAMGVFMGHWLDKSLGTHPLFIVLLSLLSLGATLRYLFNFSRKP